MTESLKLLIISQVDKEYLDDLKEARFQYKNSSLLDFLDLLIDNYQATSEERAAVKNLIEANLGPNQYIVKLFAYLKDHLPILRKMKNSLPYPDEDFIEALYMAVQKTKQFTKACAKWKRKPVLERTTEKQARVYFKDV